MLVKYGNEYHVLSFSDLIEVRTSARGNAEVLLRNPEFDITRAIRDVLYNYRAGGDLFAGIDKPVEFIGYVSNEERLPGMLLAYLDSIEQQLQQAADASGDKFSFRFIEPEAGNGDVARQIEEQWGFASMSSTLDAEQEFYFYLTLADEKQVVQLPTGDFNPTSFRKSLDTGLKRFTSDFTKTVALAAPRVSEQMAAYNLGGPSFNALQAAITRNHSIIMEDLADGEISPEADILAVVAPQELDSLALFALDQFLMRGGTLILATSPFSVEPLGGELKLRSWNSGLAAWLQHHGITIGDSLVLDKRHARFPAPVQRGEGDYQFQDSKIVDYPFFVDVREDGFGRHPINASLPQLTMAWASPLEIERGNQRRVSQLLWSSQDSWLETDDDIAARENDDRSPTGTTGRKLLGAILQGRFQSYFKAPPAELAALPSRVSAGVNSFVKRSPESARIIVYSSNDFLSDRVLGALVQASGSRYLGPLELFSNSIDWALQDQQLLQIRSRAHFNRTLPPMEQQHRLYLELFNYAAALFWLSALALVFWVRRRRLARYYARELGL